MYCGRQPIPEIISSFLALQYQSSVSPKHCTQPNTSPDSGCVVETNFTQCIFENYTLGAPAIVGNFSKGAILPPWDTVGMNEVIEIVNSNFEDGPDITQFVLYISGFMGSLLATDFRPRDNMPFYLSSKNRLYWQSGYSYVNLTGCDFTELSAQGATFSASFDPPTENLHIFSNAGNHWEIDPDTGICNEITPIAANIVSPTFISYVNVVGPSTLFGIDKSTNSFGTIDLTTGIYTPNVTIQDTSILSQVYYMDTTILPTREQAVVVVTPGNPWNNYYSLDLTTGEFSAPSNIQFYNKIFSFAPIDYSTVRPPTPTPTPTPDCGTSGHMRCVSMNQYQTCDHGVWQATQTCQTGLTCQPAGNWIYCQ